MKDKNPINIRAISDYFSPCSWKSLKCVVKLIQLCRFYDCTIFLLSVTAYSFSMIQNNFALSDLGVVSTANMALKQNWFILILLPWCFLTCFPVILQFIFSTSLLNLLSQLCLFLSGASGNSSLSPTDIRNRLLAFFCSWYLQEYTSYLLISPSWFVESSLRIKQLKWNKEKKN